MFYLKIDIVGNFYRHAEVSLKNITELNVIGQSDEILTCLTCRKEAYVQSTLT